MAHAVEAFGVVEQEFLQHGQAGVSGAGVAAGPGQQVGVRAQRAGWADLRVVRDDREPGHRLPLGVDVGHVFVGQVGVHADEDRRTIAVPDDRLHDAVLPEQRPGPGRVETHRQVTERGPGRVIDAVDGEAERGDDVFDRRWKHHAGQHRNGSVEPVQARGVEVVQVLVAEHDRVEPRHERGVHRAGRPDAERTAEPETHLQDRIDQHRVPPGLHQPGLVTDERHPHSSVLHDLFLSHGGDRAGRTTGNQPLVRPARRGDQRW
ncbi:hypothetical protein POF50_021955 [Streptomyces sp. SL13]|uniref:Uncharacterized protein n=1 Tax=Streptantibioticus silvisoli TaxID=2705255 RepID=A0AA90KAD2_9ACTN|nr:hypothetical protein [Streptantibioticus silvisoli]MDI5971967.1 hypothetical protein [Streptantibioticus silvisoli]